MKSMYSSYLHMQNMLHCMIARQLLTLNSSAANKGSSTLVQSFIPNSCPFCNEQVIGQVGVKLASERKKIELAKKWSAGDVEVEPFPSHLRLRTGKN